MSDEWADRKLAQWERVKDALPGLQLSRHGQNKATFLLRIAVTDDGQDEFTDHLIYGRPAYPGIPAVDLSDAAIDVALARWQDRQRLAEGSKLGGSTEIVWKVQGTPDWGAIARSRGKRRP